MAGAALVALAAVAPLHRQTGVPSWRTIWAEDGAVFLSDAYRDGVVAVVLRGYGGYLQLPPRLLVAPATVLPARWVPFYLAVTATTLTALLAWGVYRWSSAWIASRLVRLAVALMLVAAPAMGAETTANLTNLIWIFAAATPWALVAPEETRAATAVRAIVVFFAATATVVAILFVPLAAIHWWWRRGQPDRVSTGVTVSYGLGVVLQLAVVAGTSDQVRPDASNSLDQLLTQFGVHVTLELLLGHNGAQSVWSEWGTVAAVSAVIVVALGLVALLWKVRESHPRVAVLSAAFSATALVVFAAPLLARGTSATHLVEGGLIGGAGLRYGVVPAFLLFSAFGLAIDAFAAEANRPGIARIGLLAQALVVVATSFFVTSGRSAGPAVPDPGTLSSCRTSPRPSYVSLPISPLGWTFGIPCEVLERDAS